MPIDPKALEAFLNKPIAHQPAFKGAPPDKLKQVIYGSTGYPFTPGRTTLRPHQLEGLAFALYHRRALLYFSMQLGKTLTSLEWAQHLRRARLWQGKGLIIAHAPVGLLVWQTQIEQHSDLRAAYVHKDPDELLAAVESDVDLVVIPWTGLQALLTEKRLSRKGKPKLYPNYERIAALAEHFSLTIIDEIHMSKNHMSLRFQIASELVKGCKYRLGLTGTPLGRKPFASWASTYLIDAGETLSKSYYFFEEAFGVKRKHWFSPKRGSVWNERKQVYEFVPFEWAFDNRKLPLLTAKLASIALSYQLHEVRAVDIEASVTQLRMGAEQHKAYRDAIHHAINLRGGDRIAIENTFMRLRQISSGFVPFEDSQGQERVLQFPDSAKQEWFDAFLESLDTDMQIVIFHEFTRTGSLLCEQLTKAKIKHGWLYGGTKDRKAVVEAFQSGKSQVLVANTRTGGMSIPLPMAGMLLFYESTVDPIIRAQAEGRPMGEARGNRKLLILDLITSPIETRILDMLREGKNLLAAVMRDPRLLLAGPLPNQHKPPRNQPKLLAKAQ